MVLHPPYNPGLAPYDFWMFGLLKAALQERNLLSDDEMNAVLQLGFLATKIILQQELKKLVEQWNRCLTVRGDC